jgi:uncharacterized BrkB/YihY/UPF0761 family membrane protein
MFNARGPSARQDIAVGQPSFGSRRSLSGFIRKCLNDWSIDFASALAYNSVTALLPITVVAFGIFGLIVRDNADARQTIVDAIADLPSDNNTKVALRQVSTSDIERRDT